MKRKGGAGKKEEGEEKDGKGQMWKEKTESVWNGFELHRKLGNSGSAGVKGNGLCRLF